MGFRAELGLGQGRDVEEGAEEARAANPVVEALQRLGVPVRGAPAWTGSAGDADQDRHVAVVRRAIGEGAAHKRRLDPLIFGVGGGLSNLTGE